MRSTSRTLSAALVLLGLLLTPLALEGATTCARSGCNIVITISLVTSLSSGDPTTANDTVNAWIADIESVWNGPVQGDGPSPTYGECKCPVTVDVVHRGWVNGCKDPAAAGSHCIEMTAEPARDRSGELHRGYMRGIVPAGTSTTGWWSSGAMNQPVVWAISPGQTITWSPVHDAAHEAGHMLGLEDDYDKAADYYGPNIMGQTYGPNAQPTQDQIDDIVGANCSGTDAECPDHCCCGNGTVEADKNEECDPKADPNGCQDPAELCVNCVCFGPPNDCGNGAVEPGEECDPPGEPSCPVGQDCFECSCYFVFYLDFDGDGFGSMIEPPILIKEPIPPLGYTAEPGDCDDENPFRHPLMPEICGDQMDQNCNPDDDC